MTTDTVDEQFASHCEPLFLLDNFIGDGHSEATQNGTVTYVKLDQRVYAVTCRHVIEDNVSDSKQAAVTHQRSFMYFRSTDPGSGRYVTCFRYPLPEVDADNGPDVAICSLGVGMPWTQDQKGKRPIDLDSWTQPDWPTVHLGAAVGFCTEHKIVSGSKVRSPQYVVTATLSSTVRLDTRDLVLSDELAEAHGIFFSGMSGGPIFVVDDGGIPTFAGIVYQGTPGGSEAWNQRDPNQSFVRANDVLIKGHLVTPERLRAWIASCEF